MRRLTSFIVTATLAAITVPGIFGADTAKEDMKQAGGEVKEAGKAGGRAAKDTGKATKKTSKKVVNKAGEKTEEGADKVRSKTQP